MAFFTLFPGPPPSYLSSPSRTLLILWSSLSLLLSLAGNTLVLRASLAHNAIRLDKVSVVLVRSIAVVDLCSAVTVILPGITGLVAEVWVLGEWLCLVCAYLTYVLPIANALLIAGLNCNKLYCLLYPFRSRVLSTSTGIKLSSFLIFLASTYIVQNVICERPAAFDRFVYRCTESGDSPLWEVTSRINSIVYVLLPLGLIVGSTLWLLLFVGSRGVLRSQSVALILSVSIVHLLSYGPFVVYQIQREPLHTFYIFAVFINYLSTFSNPLLYYWSSLSFKLYMDSLVTGITRRVSSTGRLPRLGSYGSSGRANQTRGLDLGSRNGLDFGPRVVQATICTSEL